MFCALLVLFSFPMFVDQYFNIHVYFLPIPEHRWHSHMHIFAFHINTYVPILSPSSCTFWLPYKYAPVFPHSCTCLGLFTGSTCWFSMCTSIYICIFIYIYFEVVPTQFFSPLCVHNHSLLLFALSYVIFQIHKHLLQFPSVSISLLIHIYIYIYIYRYRYR